MNAPWPSIQKKEDAPELSLGVHPPHLNRLYYAYKFLTLIKTIRSTNNLSLMFTPGPLKMG
ncbi:hypothetical protein B9T62_25255 [Paenibacillus donghaensis]|uniref:Uncharacterized protein n=1 Tax=Paenibacillus donghaensis TaxID=414771 RepID=A0A2Z2KDP8_9BACL|nr:hypothetical protein B9T62_25255 [Paenibacillus donghaensis]